MKIMVLLLCAHPPAYWEKCNYALILDLKLDLKKKFRLILEKLRKSR